MNHKTIGGRIVNMEALQKQYETIKAVGNVPMNARGDRLNENGDVKYTVAEMTTAQLNDPETPPESRPMSKSMDKPKTTKKASSKIVNKKSITDSDNNVVSEEIEYDDGSIEVVDFINKLDMDEK